MDKPPLIRRVVIHNYKSIAQCDVTLGRFNVFVGRNGAGKSNFLDALQFVAQALSPGSLSHALESRGGMANVLRRGMKTGDNFRIELQVQWSRSQADYVIQIAKQPHGAFVVDEERLDYRTSEKGIPLFKRFIRNREKLSDSGDSDVDISSISKESLYLPFASIQYVVYGYVREALASLSIYNPIPSPMRRPHLIESGTTLKESGSNLTSVVSRLSRERPKTLARIIEYLAQIVPGLVTVQPLEIGGYEILEFRLQVPGESQPRTFQSQNMSDGTLRSLAVLVAALQFLESPDSSHVIGIEEPEAAIHPSAMAVLLDALREASVNTQILITTHSPDLVDGVDLDTDHLFAVSDTTGSTVIEPVDDASVMAIRTHLYSAGELLRMDQLEPRSVHSIEEVAPK